MHIKSELNYSLKLRLDDEVLEVPLRIGNFYIGYSDKCLVQIDFGDPSQVYALDVREEILILKSLNPLYTIKYDNVDYQELKIDRSITVAIGSVDFIIEFISLTKNPEMTGTISINNLLDKKKQSNKLPPLPDLPSNEKDLPSTPSFIDDAPKKSGETKIVVAPVKVKVVQDDNSEISLDENYEEVRSTSKAPVAQEFKPSFININGDIEDANISKLVYIDDMLCDINFDEDKSDLIKNVENLDLDYTFDEFIDFDESFNKDKFKLEKDNAPRSIEISSLHNGLLLSQDYFSFDYEKIFASSTSRGRKLVHINCIESKKKVVILEKVDVNSQLVFAAMKLDGFTMTVWDCENKCIDIDDPYRVLVANESIVYTKDLHQIIIKESFVPPSIEKTRFFAFDDELLKFFVLGFAAILLPLLLILVFTETPNVAVKKKEDVVVIFKKKMSTNTTKNETKVTNKEPAQTPKTEVQKEVEAKPLEPKTADVKKDVEKPKTITKKSVSSKVTKSAPKSKSVANKKAPENKQVKAPVKTYSFNTSSQFKTLLGTSASTAAQNVENKKSFVAEGTSGTKFTNSVTKGEINNVSSGAKGFSGKEVGNVDKSFGAEGLSGKSGIDTAYMESQTKVLGAIDPNLIRKILREYIPQFRYCYHQELRKDDSIAGVFDLEFKINSDGKGSAVNILTKDKPFSQAGIGCIRNVIALIQFPKVKGGGFVEVVQPLNFQSTTR